MKPAKFVNYSNLQIDSLAVKKKHIKAASSVKLSFTAKNLEHQGPKKFQFYNLKNFKHIRNLHVSLNGQVDDFKLEKTLKTYRKRLDSLVVLGNNNLPANKANKEEGKVLLNLPLKFETRVKEVNNFVLTPRTLKRVNHIRNLNYMIVLLDEFEDIASINILAQKIARLRRLCRINVISQDPERINTLAKKVNNLHIVPEIGAVIPRWNGIDVQQSLAMKSLFKEITFISVICHDSLNSLVKAFDLDGENNSNLEWLKLKISLCSGFGNVLTEDNGILLKPNANTLCNLSSFKQLKKIELSLSPKVMFGQAPTSDLRKLLCSLVLPSCIEELALSIQEILLDEEIKIEEITSSLIKILSPLNNLKNLKLVLLFAGEVNSFQEHSFATLIKNITNLETLQLTITMLSPTSRNVFKFGDLLASLTYHRNLKSLDLEVPHASLSGLSRLNKNPFPNLNRFSLKGVGNIGGIVAEGGEEITDLLTKLSLGNMEAINLDLSCQISSTNILPLIENLNKMDKIRELRVRMLWEDYLLVERLLKALDNKNTLKKLFLEFPSWKSGPKAAKIFFEAFQKGYHEDIDQFRFLSRSFAACKTPKRSLNYLCR